jgi:hypothetical protein
VVWRDSCPSGATAPFSRDRDFHFTIPDEACRWCGRWSRVSSPPTTGSTSSTSRSRHHGIPATAARRRAGGEPARSLGVARPHRGGGGGAACRQDHRHQGQRGRRRRAHEQRHRAAGRLRPDEDATVVERVLDAGATILGNAVWREPVLLWQQPPMARSMHDVALLLQTIPGTDVLDPRQHGASAAPTTWDALRRSRRAALAVVREGSAPPTPSRPRSGARHRPVPRTRRWWLLPAE